MGKIEPGSTLCFTSSSVMPSFCRYCLDMNSVCGLSCIQPIIQALSYVIEHVRA